VEHHADFSVPMRRRLGVRTRGTRPLGAGTVVERVLALGRWVDADAGANRRIARRGLTSFRVED